MLVSLANATGRNINLHKSDRKSFMHVLDMAGINNCDGATIDGVSKLFTCNAIGHIGKLRKIGLVKGMIHGNHLVDT